MCKILIKDESILSYKYKFSFLEESLIMEIWLFKVNIIYGLIVMYVGIVIDS